MSDLECELEALMSLFPEARIDSVNGCISLPVSSDGNSEVIIATLHFKLSAALFVTDTNVDGGSRWLSDACGLALRSTISLLALSTHGDAGDGVAFADSARAAIRDARTSSTTLTPCAICLDPVNVTDTDTVTDTDADADTDPNSLSLITLTPCAHGPFHCACVGNYWDAVRECAAEARAPTAAAAASSLAGSTALRIAAASEAANASARAEAVFVTAIARAAVSAHALTLSPPPNPSAAAAAALSGGSASARRARREASEALESARLRATALDATACEIAAALSPSELLLRAKADSVASDVARASAVLAATRARAACGVFETSNESTRAALAKPTHTLQLLPVLLLPCPVCRAPASALSIATIEAYKRTMTTGRLSSSHVRVSLPTRRPTEPTTAATVFVGGLTLDAATARYARDVAARHARLWDKQIRLGAIIDREVNK